MTLLLKRVAFPPSRLFPTSATGPTSHLHTLPDMIDLTRGSAAIQVPRPPKRASKRASEIAARVLQIKAGLEGQEKRRADYKKTLPAKTSNRGLLYLIKKNSWEK